MDQDIHFQHQTGFINSGETTTYFYVPYRCTLRNVIGIVQGDPGDNETVTVTCGATAAAATTELGVLTFGDDITAGAIGTWAEAATTGGTVMEAGYWIKLVATAGAEETSVVCDIDIELDPYAR